MCEYCTNTTSKKALVSGKYLGISLSGNKPNVYMWGKDERGWDTSEQTQFNYCPKCGKKLSDTNEDALNSVFCVMDNQNKVFAIYKTEERAEDVSSKMTEKHGEYYYVATWQVH